MSFAAEHRTGRGSRQSMQFARLPCSSTSACAPLPLPVHPFLDVVERHPEAAAETVRLNGVVIRVDDHVTPVVIRPRIASAALHQLIALALDRAPQAVLAHLRCIFHFAGSYPARYVARYAARDAGSQARR